MYIDEKVGEVLARVGYLLRACDIQNADEVITSYDLLRRSVAGAPLTAGAKSKVGTKGLDDFDFNAIADAVKVWMRYPSQTFEAQLDGVMRGVCVLLVATHFSRVHCEQVDPTVLPEGVKLALAVVLPGENQEQAHGG